MGWTTYQPVEVGGLSTIIYKVLGGSYQVPMMAENMELWIDILDTFG